MNIFLLIYLAVISLVAVFATANDKFKATRGKRYNRTPESTLITLGVLGGSLAMFLTMLIIRHKTRKPKFMLGLPIIMAVQIGLLFLAFKSGGFLV